MTEPTYADVDALLAAARSRLSRLTPEEAFAQVSDGTAQIVDIRPAWQRAQDGEIPGSVIIERNHLEWRVHPTSSARLALADTVQRWVIVCTEGYTSSLAAASLVSLGLDATDIVGGLHAWAAAGQPVARTVTGVEEIVG